MSTVQDFNENSISKLLKHLTLLRSPLLLKKVERVDNIGFSLGTVKEHISRANISHRLNRLNSHHVSLGNNLTRVRYRHNSR